MFCKGNVTFFGPSKSEAEQREASGPSRKDLRGDKPCVRTVFLKNETKPARSNRFKLNQSDIESACVSCAERKNITTFSFAKLKRSTRSTACSDWHWKHCVNASIKTEESACLDRERQ